MIEVLIVVAIMSLIAAGVTVAVLPRWREAQIRMAFTNAQSLRQGVAAWRANRAADECPTLAQLRSDKVIDQAAKLEDPWGALYKITCLDDDATVSSPGPDRREGTTDDIFVPSKNGAPVAPPHG